MKTRALTTLGLFGALALASAQTILNPSFEANSFTNGVGYIADNDPIVGWTTADPAHAGLNSASGPFANNGTIPDGANVAFIQSGTNSYLSTVISNLTVGQSYAVSFRANARSGNTPNLKVDIAGINLINTTVTSVGGTAPYRHFAFNFTAAASTQTMAVLNDAGGDNTLLVDNFSIAAEIIPNPSFEINSFTNPPGYVSSNSPIAGWTTTNPNRAGLNPATGNPFADNGAIPDGANVAFIQSGTNSSLSTIISVLTVGETYKVNFRVNARANGGTSPPGPHMPNLKVAIDGADLLSAIVTNVDNENSLNKSYQYFAFDFTAAATSQMMTLRNDATNNDNTVLLDNFSIAPRNSGWSYAAWNDDASSGVVVSPTNYTHAYRFGDSSIAKIYGVNFIGIPGFSPSSNGVFSTTGLSTVSGLDSNNVTGASSLLAQRFVYGGSPESITLSGLVVGNSYVTTIYSVGYDTNGARAATFSVGNDRLTVNQDQFGNDNGIRVSYNFTANSTANTITYTPLAAQAETFHTYGFANYQVPQPPPANPSFEVDTVPPYPGFGLITGWTVTGGGINNTDGPFQDNGAIPNGTNVAFISTNGALSQVVTGFIAGVSYQLHYYENSCICGGGPAPFAEVQIGGRTIVAPHAVTPVGGNNPYHEVLSDVFVATATSLELDIIKSSPQGGNPTLLIDNVSFVPPRTAVLPVPVTLAADQVATNTARLNGQVNPQGSPTTAWFQWGTDTNYANATAPQAVGSGLSLSNVRAALSGLLGEQYHFRLVASNAFGTVTGTDQVFSIQGFYSIAIPGLLGVQFSSVAWGDFDNDGRLDFLITGTTDGSIGGTISQLWRNTGNGFTNIPIPGLPGVQYGSVAWGDFDNDGRLDFLLTGYAPIDGFSVSQLWRNTGNGFTNIPIPGLPGVQYGSVAWGDFDNDGRPDFLLTGTTNGNLTGAISQVWRNTGSGFSNVTAIVAPGLPGVALGSVAWGDFDNDGRLDFLITGTTDGSIGGTISQLWRNTGNGFTNVPIAFLPGVYDGSVAWGDFDNDGRLDFLLTGYAPIDGFSVSQLWRNTDNGFTNVPIPGLQGFENGSVAWGDFDNDGRLDFLITGTPDGTSGISQLWRNTGNGFTNVPIPFLPGVYYSSVAWGDFDNNGRLDFLLTGYAPIDGFSVSLLWRNNFPGLNAPPAAPAGLSSTVSGATVTLNWSASADDHTPAAGLNYNVRIGTTPGGSEILAPQSLANGTRLVPQIGNAGPGLTALYGLAPGADYYWSVQAVDSSFAGSPFAAEAQLTVPPLLIQPLRLGNSVFQFTFTNSASGTWDIHATTNLALPVVNWDNLGLPTALGSNNLYQFKDFQAPNFPQRVYRLQKQ
jgi:hypothetical protein